MEIYYALINHELIMPCLFPQVALDFGLSYSKLRALLRGQWDTPNRISSLLATVSTAVSEFEFCLCHLLR